MVGANLFADRTFGSGFPQPAANYNLAIGTGRLFEGLKRHGGMSKAENSRSRMVHLSRRQLKVSTASPCKHLKLRKIHV